MRHSRTCRKLGSMASERALVRKLGTAPIGKAMTHDPGAVPVNGKILNSLAWIPTVVVNGSPRNARTSPIAALPQVGCGPSLLGSTFEWPLCPRPGYCQIGICCDQHQRPLFPLRGSVGFYAIAANAVLRARATRLRHDRNGLRLCGNWLGFLTTRMFLSILWRHADSGSFWRPMRRRGWGLFR